MRGSTRKRPSAEGVGRAYFLSFTFEPGALAAVVSWRSLGDGLLKSRNQLVLTEGQTLASFVPVPASVAARQRRAARVRPALNISGLP
jgi:hypothetical protein